MKPPMLLVHLVNRYVVVNSPLTNAETIGHGITAIAASLRVDKDQTEMFNKVLKAKLDLTVNNSNVRSVTTVVEVVQPVALVVVAVAVVVSITIIHETKADVQVVAKVD